MHACMRACVCVCVCVCACRAKEKGRKGEVKREVVACVGVCVR